MVMPQPFTTASPILANYSFIEWATGIGYIVYEGGQSTSGLMLLTQTFETNETEYFTEYEASTSTGTFDYEYSNSFINLDMPVIRDLVLDGEAYIRCSFGSMFTNGGAIGNAKILFELIDYDGSTETVLATSDFSNELEIPVTTTAYYSEGNFIAMNIDNKRVSRGHTLRLKAKLYIEVTTGTGTINTRVGLATNPTNDATTNYSDGNSNFKFYAPLKQE